jgi:glycosyltransferase involved in cell wall biosynthesis
MPKIVYLSPFPRHEITGGIKVMFRHVEMLQKLGFDASIYSPDGHPNWMSSSAPLFVGTNPAADPDNAMVFPEVLTGVLGQAVRTPTPASKVLLCQNQYHIFNETVPAMSLAELSFAKLITVGELSKRFLERVLGPASFDVVPVWVDRELFFPRSKSLRIATFPKKLPIHYALIRRIFEAKYPRYRKVPWDLITAKSEDESAEILGRCAVLLSLCERECVPLTALEAMASGCIVVGFHGYGGQEYATDDNGIWLRPDHLEETADALADALAGVEADSVRSHGLRAAALATAQRFNRGETEAALRRTFGSLGEARG